MIDFLVGPQLLTPLAQKVTDALVKICKDFKADVRQQLRDDINSYIGNFVNKFSKIKTFLYSDQRKDFYEVYFPLYLCHPAHRDKRILVPDNPDNLFAHNNYVTILGHAGCGKTMILRHLFLSACNKSAKIPLVVELRKLKDFDGSFADYISDKVFHFKISQNSNIAQRMLKSGEFLFLLDGYDEIAFAQKDKITHELEDFVDQYPDNYYFLTSRPGSGAETLERFDKHNDLGTNTPFDIYRHIKDNQHLSIDEYTNLSWTNEGNGISLKAFRWDNYITQCMYLFPQWFWDVVYSTRTSLGRSEREKLLGATIQSVSASKLLSYIEDNLQVDEDGEQLNRAIGQESVKWIVNLDLDYFFHSSDDGYIQILSDEYIRILAQKLRNCKHSINVLTIALSPECCGNWGNAIHALNVFMEAYEERPYGFPDDYQ